MLTRDLHLYLLGLVLILELENLSLAFSVPLEVLHALDRPPNHLVLGVLHDLPLDLLVSDASLGNSLFAGDIEPDILDHA